MSYVKQNFVDGQTLTAAQLNHMEAGIANAAGTQGEKGDKGEKGDPGPAGAKTELVNGELVITYSPAKTFSFGGCGLSECSACRVGRQCTGSSGAEREPERRDHDPEREREQDPDGHRAARERNQ